jgi:hypothetical protein
LAQDGMAGAADRGNSPAPHLSVFLAYFDDAKPRVRKWRKGWAPSVNVL